MARQVQPVADRLVSKVIVDLVTDCWLWTAHLNNRGYGVIGVGHDKLWLAHRLSYETFVGPIPEGLVLDHLCSTPPCIYPPHLEPVTQEENMRRARPDTTYCPQGHLKTGDNLVLRPNRTAISGECRQCIRERDRRNYAKRRDARG